MRKDFYVECATEADAQSILREIDDARGSRWAEPQANAFGPTVVFAWNCDELSELEHLILGLPRLSYDQAVRAGYCLGYHRGRFALAAQKLEDARYILKSMKSTSSHPNFAAFRALYYGFIGGLYAAREAIQKSCNRIGGDAAVWWAAEKRRLKSSEPLLRQLDVDYQNEKHGDSRGVLILSCHSHHYIGPVFDTLSGEGPFNVYNRGTPEEFRLFVHAPGIVFKPYLKLDQMYLTVNGNSVAEMDLTGQLQELFNLHWNLLVTCRERFDANEKHRLFSW